MTKKRQFLLNIRAMSIDELKQKYNDDVKSLFVQKLRASAIEASEADKSSLIRHAKFARRNIARMRTELRSAELKSAVKG
jgi:ribosomal protein L29